MYGEYFSHAPDSASLQRKSCYLRQQIPNKLAVADDLSGYGSDTDILWDTFATCNLQLVLKSNIIRFSFENNTDNDIHIQENNFEHTHCIVDIIQKKRKRQ